MASNSVLSSMSKRSINTQFRRLRCLALVISLWMTVAPSVWAHQGEPLEPHDLWRAWSWEPGVVLSLALSAWLYFRGVRRLWRGSSRVIRRWEAAAFAAGWLALFLALISPLHPLGGALFSAHMVQHEILMLVAAPLLVLGRPLLPCLWALPPHWRRIVGKVGQVTWIENGWRAITNPFTAWTIH